MYLLPTSTLLGNISSTIPVRTLSISSAPCLPPWGVWVGQNWVIYLEISPHLQILLSEFTLQNCFVCSFLNGKNISLMQSKPVCSPFAHLTYSRAPFFPIQRSSAKHTHYPAFTSPPLASSLSEPKLNTMDKSVVLKL